MTSNDNVRSKNSKTFSVGQDLVNCIFVDESMELIRLKNLSESFLECSHKNKHVTKMSPSFYGGYVARSFKIEGVHYNINV